MGQRMEIFDLTGKVAVVTGGNGGIGLGMARGLARAGASIAVVARNEEKSAQAIFLASSASNFITGAVIPVDGGFSVSG